MVRMGRLIREILLFLFAIAVLAVVVLAISFVIITVVNTVHHMTNK